MAFGLDFLGGVAGFIGQQINTSMTADLQASADEKKAKLLNKLQQDNIKLEQDLLGKREERQQTALYDRAMAEQEAMTAREAAKQAELNQRAVDERQSRAAIAAGRNAASTDAAAIRAQAMKEAAAIRAASRPSAKEKTNPFARQGIMGLIDRFR